jgi:hypothetical protein
MENSHFRLWDWREANNVSQYNMNMPQSITNWGGGGGGINGNKSGGYKIFGDVIVK